MISYTSRYVNIVSLFITIIIYIFFSKSILILKKTDFNSPLISSMIKRSSILVEINSNNINQDTKEKNNESQNNTPNSIIKDKNVQWKLIIPKILLEAEISEGTSKEVMNRYIGHFEETSKKSGNIGLAAHNRGYEVNYFSEIKLLKEGDKIIYKFYDFENTYIVIENKIIKDTDWSYLEKTEENKITLITCVENEPEYRRCIQAIEEKEVIK